MFRSRLHAPIVLTHGLFGFSRIGYGRVTLVRYFRGVPEMLRAAGNRVYVARVHPTAGVERRARKLAERIETAFGDEPVHLIGHSLGGLDARQLAANPKWAGRILSVTTIGSPHLGSPLAELALRKLGSIYRFLERLDWDHQGFYDHLPERARAWNETTIIPDAIPCFHITGAPEGTLSWPLRKTGQLLSDLCGPNDGLVPHESARAFGTPLDTWPADHFHQMNWMTNARQSAAILAGYGRIVTRLAELGFGEEAAAAASASPRSPEPALL